MLTESAKFLRGFCLLASRKLYLEFHTSACAFKGGSYRKKRSSNGRGEAQPARTSSRKRLVPTLKPDGQSGTYEVAPRPSKSRDEIPRLWEDHDEAASALKGTESSQRREDGSSSSQEGAFSREAAPHVGRASWRRPRNSALPRRDFENPDYDIVFDDHTSAFHGLRGTNLLPRQKNESQSRDVPIRGDPLPEPSHMRRRPRSYEVESSHRPKSSKPDNLHDHLRSSRGVFQEDFHTPPQTEPLKTLPAHFTSPPLLSGLLQSVHEVLGPDTKPSPIQSLSLKHLFDPPSHIFPTDTKDRNSEEENSPPAWGQYLLASETGSGKSMAYLLPMMQYLKLTEGSPAPLFPFTAPPPDRSISLNPRGLILAPTHELSRQLSSFAKALLHNVRLRVLCASRANTLSSSRGKNSTASQMKRELDEVDFGLTDEAHITRKSRPVDVLVGTPTKVLEMVRGWGWNRADRIEDRWDDAAKERARNWIPGPPEAELGKVEWVVIDEADILFDSDFEESTRMLLADIAQARGYAHPSFLAFQKSSANDLSPDKPPQPLAYPFHLVLTSATIPSSLASYLTINHPTLTRLASPNLHHLPSTLKTEYTTWTSGNKNSDIERRIRHVWAEDARSNTTKSKILVFCNKSSKVEDLGLYLKEKGIPNVALTSTASARFRGSNRHLAGFLKATDDMPPQRQGWVTDSDTSAAARLEPHVMITTSLLSRGLDFSPQIKHVFIADEPRNMIDFLHRAGRSGRAGKDGKVVIFGKMKGRGSENAKAVRRRIGALAH